MYGNVSLAKEVGRSGIEELYEKGYDVNQIAFIYDVSNSTIYSTLRALYGLHWKHTLVRKRNEFEGKYLCNEEHMFCSVI